MRIFSVSVLKKYVVEKLNENFKDYKIIAFIAPKGSGKTTAANLVRSMLKDKSDVITLYLPFALTIKNTFNNYCIKMYKDIGFISETKHCLSSISEHITMLIDYIERLIFEAKIISTTVGYLLNNKTFSSIQNIDGFIDRTHMHYICLRERLKYCASKIKNIADIIVNEIEEGNDIDESLIKKYDKYVREIIRIVSTDILREELRPDIHVIAWLVNLLKEIEFLTANTNTKEKTLIVLVDDMRFINEYAELLSLFKDKFIPVGIVNRAVLEQRDTHQSESEPRLILEKFPIIKIENDISKGIEFLKQELEEKLLKKEEVLV